MSNYSNSSIAVTFSQFSQLNFIPEDNVGSKKCYSHQEQKCFRRQLIRDTMRMSKELEDKPAGAITPELLYKCIGIEIFLTQGLARHVHDKKRAHVDAVLLEQRVQKQQGICDPEKLSSISKKNPRWTRNRAQKLAMGYAKLNE